MNENEQVEGWIHARIDGELTPQETVLLERALAADPELARWAQAVERVDREAAALLPTDVESDAAAVARVLAGVAAQLEAPAGEAAPEAALAPVLAFTWRRSLVAAALVIVGVGAWVRTAGFGPAAPREVDEPAVAEAGEPAREPLETAIGLSDGGAVQADPAVAQGSGGPADPPLEPRVPAVPTDPLVLLAAAGAGPLDEPSLVALLNALDDLGLGGYRTVELAGDLFTGDGEVPQPALHAAAALLAFDGGPGALRALEKGLEVEATAASCAAALVSAGPRGAQRLHRHLRDERLGRTAALALAAGGADDLELLIARLDEQPDEELFAALVGADADLLNRVMDRADPSVALLDLAVAARPSGALELLVRAARDRDAGRVALAHLVHWGEPAGLRAVLELLEYGQVDRADVERNLRTPKFDGRALLPLAQQLSSGSDRRWRAALLGLLIENPISGSEPTLLELSAADDLPQDQRLLGVLGCATIEGPLDEVVREALVTFVANCGRDDARLAACALVAIGRRSSLDAALSPFAWNRSTERLAAVIAPFSIGDLNSIDAETPRAFTSSDVSRVARTLEPHLPLQDLSNI